MYLIYRIGHAQLVVKKCPHSLDLRDIIEVSSPGTTGALTNMENDFQELKAEFTEGRTSISRF